MFADRSNNIGGSGGGITNSSNSNGITMLSMGNIINTHTQKKTQLNPFRMAKKNARNNNNIINIKHVQSEHNEYIASN